MSFPIACTLSGARIYVTHSHLLISFLVDFMQVVHAIVESTEDATDLPDSLLSEIKGNEVPAEIMRSTTPRCRLDACLAHCLANGMSVATMTALFVPDEDDELAIDAFDDGLRKLCPAWLCFEHDKLLQLIHIITGVAGCSLAFEELSAYIEASAKVHCAPPRILQQHRPHEGTDPDYLQSLPAAVKRRW
jgi:hypothetical protein